MKHQYFGDINDFHKYGLLQILCGEGKLRLGVCWMLTRDDRNNDGSRTGYLKAPGKWRAFNPHLFDLLLACVKGSGMRDISKVESLHLLPSAKFYSGILTDSSVERKRYFDEVRERFAETDLVFLDPDNGLEVASVPFGCKNSSKYLYLREVSDVYRAGHSVLVYQHFCREERDQFVRKLTARLGDSTGTKEVHSFRTAHTVFLLVPQSKDIAYFRHAAARVQEMWAPRFEVQRYRSDQ